MERLCECGCGKVVTGKTRHGERRFVSGHNLRGLVRTEQHRKRIGQAQKRAWETKRERLPIGTKRRNADGYVVVKVVAGSGRWRLEHVMVMEKTLGRSLAPGEVVHHINGVRADNRPENLYLCRSHSHHNEVEATLAEVFRAMLVDGLVSFNQETGRYERTHAVLPRR